MEKKMGKSCENKSALHSCVGKSQGLVSLIEYSHDSIVSKVIVDTPAGTITLFAFDKGQKLSEHTAPYNAVVQIIDGSAHLTIGGKNYNAGQCAAFRCCERKIQNAADND
jgi:quercetin dioxygenase-like cupin family protein